MATQSQQVIQTSTLPAAFEPFYKTGLTAAESPTKTAIPGLIPQAFGLYGQGTPEQFNKTYVQPLKAAGLYGADRIADLTDTQKKVGTEITGMTTPGQFGLAQTSLTGLPSLMDAATLQSYMSPYSQGVVDVQQRKAIEDAKKAQLLGNLGAARKGQLGGSAQILAGTERERALQTQLGDIQTKGLQDAFTAAQKGIESDRNARIQAAEQFRQLGIAEQTADIDRLKLLGAYGDLEQKMEQQKLDTRYQELMRGIQYPETQLEKLSSFIRGVPLTDLVRTQTENTPTPGLLSQLTGAGLQSLSLMNLLGGSK
jgi:hypothetical protein